MTTPDEARENEHGWNATNQERRRVERVLGAEKERLGTARRGGFHRGGSFLA
jgi:hypothetical protein